MCFVNKNLEIRKIGTRSTVRMKDKLVKVVMIERITTKRTANFVDISTDFDCVCLFGCFVGCHHFPPKYCAPTSGNLST